MGFGSKLLTRIFARGNDERGSWATLIAGYCNFASLVAVV